MRIGYLYEMHDEALRCVNDTCTKSEKKRKDAIITPAFIAVYPADLKLYFCTSRQASSLSNFLRKKHILL